MAFLKPKCLIDVQEGRGHWEVWIGSHAPLQGTGSVPLGHSKGGLRSPVAGCECGRRKLSQTGQGPSKRTRTMPGVHTGPRIVPATISQTRKYIVHKILF